MKKKRDLEKEKKELAEKMEAANKAINDAKAAWARECSAAEKERKIEEYAAFLRAEDESDPADTLRLLILKLRRLRERLTINHLTMSTGRNAKQIARVENLLAHALAGRRPPPDLPPAHPLGRELKIETYLKEVEDDSDSDYDSILYLLAFRTQRVAQLYSAEQERGSLIAAASEAFRRVAEDDYEHKEMRKVEEKFGELQMEEGEPDELGMIPMDLHYLNETKENAKEVREMVRAAWQTAETNRKKDFRIASDLLLKEMFAGYSRLGSIRRAFRQMEEQIWGWWD